MKRERISSAHLGKNPKTSKVAHNTSKVGQQDVEVASNTQMREGERVEYPYNLFSLFFLLSSFFFPLSSATIFLVQKVKWCLQTNSLRPGYSPILFFSLSSSSFASNRFFAERKKETEKRISRSRLEFLLSTVYRGRGNVMCGKVLNLNELPMEDGLTCYVKLQKDYKTICRTQCIDPPVQFPALWNISDLKPTTKYPLTGLPRFFLRPACQNDLQSHEWDVFTKFLQKHNRVAVVLLEAFECYILPPDVGTDFTDAVVLYRVSKTNNTPDNHKQHKSVSDEVQMQHVRHLTPKHEEIGDSLDTNVRGRDSSKHMAKYSSRTPCPVSVVDPRAVGYLEGLLLKQDKFVNKNFVRTDPSYLKTLGQTHSGWVFGAVAELVDNARDANATKLEISIQTHYSKKDGKKIPMLSIIDDGHGMSHQDIMVMLSFGHKQPDIDNRDHIGRFGIGFKTGAMKLGRDVIVLSQTTESRSIAFLSQSLNEGKENLEIPIVSYCRRGSFMEVDKSIQSEASADHHLRAIKEFSTFNEYFIGEKLGLFGPNGKGTQIYIWNLDKWGSDYFLEWQNGEGGKGSSNENDILIRSRRIRSRPGQVSREVPLDYSLRSYLEVIFLDPRMKIYVQGSLIKSRPLAKSLNKTVTLNDKIMGKPVQLTLGRCQLEWELSNCGIFLYWHGRLIEAYKRVGGMVHNADMGRGVIGVIDVTDLMSDGNDVLVHNTKQAFLDCEAYAKLEEWLGHKSDEYWDEHFDTLHLKKSSARYKPDHEWVQCDKCRKWRILSSRFDSTTLPQEWFCYMPPFNRKCETPEEKMEPGVVTVGAKRSGTADRKEKLVIPSEKVNSKHELDIDGSGESSQTVEDDVPSAALKRLKRGPTRNCKKEHK